MEFAPRGGTRPTAGVSIRCTPGALTGRQNTENYQMHRLASVCRAPLLTLDSCSTEAYFVNHGLKGYDDYGSNGSMAAVGPA